MRNVLLLSAFLFFGLTGSYAEGISATEAENTVRTTIDEVKNIVATDKGKISEVELDKKIEAVLMPNFDFEQMSKSSLGAGWREATPDQQTEFVKVFSSLLSHSYLAKIRKNIESSKVTILPSTVKEDRLVVHSKILSDGQQIAVDYRIYLKGGKYLVYDVIVENVGLVSNYRSEFASILDSSNFEGLLKKLRDKATKAEAV